MKQVILMFYSLRFLIQNYNLQMQAFYQILNTPKKSSNLLLCLYHCLYLKRKKFELNLRITNLQNELINSKVKKNNSKIYIPKLRA